MSLISDLHTFEKTLVQLLKEHNDIRSFVEYVCVDALSMMYIITLHLW